MLLDKEKTVRCSLKIKSKARLKSKKIESSISKSQSKSKSKSVSTKNEGSFLFDKPDFIQNAAFLETNPKEINCLVEWKQRKSGNKPSPSWIPSDVIKKKAPILLCDFLMKHIKFNPKN